MRVKRDVALGLLIPGVAAGLVFLLHGWQKLFGRIVAILETAGGLALLCGVLTRTAAVALGLEMLVAVILFHARQGLFIIAVPNVPLAYGFAYHLILIGALACLALGGAGRWALADRLAARSEGELGRVPDPADGGS